MSSRALTDNGGSSRMMVDNETGGTSDDNPTRRNTITNTHLNLYDTSADNIITTVTANDDETISTISTNCTSSTIDMTTQTIKSTQGRTTEGAIFATLSPSITVSVPQGQSRREINIQGNDNDETDTHSCADDYDIGNEDGYDSDGEK